MKGIQFVTNDSGHRTAVQIDLAEHGELWEDIYDSLVADSRRNDPRRAWDDVKRDLGLGEP